MEKVTILDHECPHFANRLLYIAGSDGLEEVRCATCDLRTAREALQKIERSERHDVARTTASLALERIGVAG